MTNKDNSLTPNSVENEKIELKFLDIVDNGYASDDNPQKIGIYLKTTYTHSHFNRGYNYHLTNGKGDFWQINKSNDKLKIVGNLLDQKVKEARIDSELKTWRTIYRYCHHRDEFDETGYLCLDDLCQDKINQLTTKEEK
jgi:hypothetical protein